MARVAGNIVNTDILGSMEFACAASGAKLVFVLGHEHCGAVKGAIDGVKLGNLSALLGVIAPAADEVPGFDGARTSKNEAFVHCVAEQNARRMLKRIRQDSPTLSDLEAQGRIRIAGGMYDMGSGQVTALQ